MQLRLARVVGDADRDRAQLGVVKLDVGREPHVAVVAVAVEQFFGDREVAVAGDPHAGGDGAVGRPPPDDLLPVHKRVDLEVTHVGNHGGSGHKPVAGDHVGQQRLRRRHGRRGYPDDVADRVGVSCPRRHVEVDEFAGGEARRERRAPLGGRPELRAAAAQPPVVRREPGLNGGARRAVAHPRDHHFVELDLVGAPADAASHPVDAIGGNRRGPRAEPRAHVGERADAEHLAPGGRRGGDVRHVHLSAALIDPAQAHKLVGAVARKPVDVVVAPQRDHIDVADGNRAACTLDQCRVQQPDALGLGRRRPLGNRLEQDNVRVPLQVRGNAVADINENAANTDHLVPGAARRRPEFEVVRILVAGEEDSV